jgi:hypothetical protein
MWRLGAHFFPQKIIFCKLLFFSRQVAKVRQKLIYKEQIYDRILFPFFSFFFFFLILANFRTQKKEKEKKRWNFSLALRKESSFGSSLVAEEERRRLRGWRIRVRFA